MIINRLKSKHPLFAGVWMFPASCPKSPLLLPHWVKQDRRGRDWNCPLKQRLRWGLFDMRFEAEQTPPCESSASLMRHWWTYDGEYSDGRDGAEHAGVETKISEMKKREGSGTCGSSGRRMNNSQDAQSPRRGWISGSGCGGQGRSPKWTFDGWWKAVGWGSWRVTAGCCVVEEETACCSVRERWRVVVEGGRVQQQQTRPFRLLFSGWKESEGVRLTPLVFAYSPLSHRLLACLLRGFLPVFRLQRNVEKQYSNRWSENELNRKKDFNFAAILLPWTLGFVSCKQTNPKHSSFSCPPLELSLTAHCTLPSIVGNQLNITTFRVHSGTSRNFEIIKYKGTNSNQHPL